MTNILNFIMNSLARLVTSGFFKPTLIFMLAMAGVAGAIAIIKRITGWRSFFSNV